MVTARRITPEPSRADDELETGVPTGRPTSGAAPAAPLANPTFGVEYWILGLVAALPTLLAALVLLACGGALPLIPRLPVGMTLGGVLIILALGALAAHVADYPAWTHPGIVLIPILALFPPRRDHPWAGRHADQWRQRLGGVGPAGDQLAADAGRDGRDRRGGGGDRAARALVQRCWRSCRCR